MNMLTKQYPLHLTLFVQLQTNHIDRFSFFFRLFRFQTENYFRLRVVYFNNSVRPTWVESGTRHCFRGSISDFIFWLAMKEIRFINRRHLKNQLISATKLTCFLFWLAKEWDWSGQSHRVNFTNHSTFNCYSQRTVKHFKFAFCLT